MPTTDELLTVLRTKGAQDVARDLKTIADAQADLGKKAEAAARLLQHEASEADKTKAKLQALGDVARITGEQQAMALGKVQERWSKIGAHAHTASAAMGGAAAAGVGFGAWLVKGAMEAEGAVAQLKVALKDDTAAQAAFQWAKKFADATPFITQSVVEASARLQISKLDMKEWTEVAGNMAAPFISSGKDITDAVEAMRDAFAGGGLERLKEFGITGSMLLDAGANRGAAGGVATQTKEDVEALKVALKAVVKEKFGDSMAEAFKTTAGALSTLQGNVETLRAELGAELIPTVTEMVAGLTEWVGKMNDLDDDTKKQIVTALKWGTAILAGGAAFAKVLGILSMFKAARVATATANITRNLAEAASANALALAYERAGGAAAINAGGGLLSGVGSAGARTGGVAVGTAAAPMAVSGMGKLTATVANLGVPLAAIAGSLWIIQRYRTDVLGSGKQVVDDAGALGAAVNNAPAGQTYIMRGPNGQTYQSGQFPTAEEFREKYAEKYRLPRNPLTGRYAWPNYGFDFGGQREALQADLKKNYGIESSTMEPMEAVLSRAYIAWSNQFSAQAVGKSDYRTQAQMAQDAQAEASTQAQQDEAARIRRETNAAELSALQKQRETRQQLMELSAGNINLFGGTGMSLSPMQSRYTMRGGQKAAGQGPQFAAFERIKQSLAEVWPQGNETFNEAWTDLQQQREGKLVDLVREYFWEEKKFIETWDDRIFAGWDPDKKILFGGEDEWQRQKREAEFLLLEKRRGMRADVLGIANSLDEEIIELSEQLLDQADKGLMAANGALVDELRGINEQAAGRIIGRLFAGGQYKQAWQLNANLQNARFGQFHGDAAEEFARLQEKTQIAMTGEQDARAFADMPAADMQRIQQQGRFLGLTTVTPGSEDTWKQRVVSGFREQLDFLREMMAQSTGTMFDGYRKQYNDVARAWQDYAMQSVDKQKAAPNIAREIIATGGVSGLAELMISRRVAGGALGRGNGGALTLSGSAADRLRAGGGDPSILRQSGSIYSATRDGKRSLRVDFYGHADDDQVAETVDKAIDGTISFLHRAFDLVPNTIRMAF